jgi:hypothetical protein
MLPGRSADRSTPTRVVSSRTGVFVGVALLAANIANYAFQVVTGRALSVADYGSLAGYMAAVTVITVSTSSLQTMAARTVAAGENDPTRRGLLDGLTRSALVWTGVVALIVVGLAPLLGRLSTFGWVVTVLLGIYVVPAAIDSIASGRLQGARRFPALAAYTTAQATGKLLVVVVALALGASVLGLAMHGCPN